jgi:hemerythrin-like domain-containing protein
MREKLIVMTNEVVQDVQHPYTREMVMIHRVFRRESRLMIELVGAVQAGDVPRAGTLAESWASYAFGLHLHHTGEDEMLWPALIGRVEGDTDLLERAEAQHQELGGGLETIGALMDRWAQTADAETRDALVEALGEHRRVLSTHLDDEERSVMPLVEKHITAQEWKALGDRGLAELPKNRLMISLGAMLEDADEREQAEFLKRLPVAARIVWRLAGQRQYRREMRRVRGPGR